MMKPNDFVVAIILILVILFLFGYMEMTDRMHEYCFDHPAASTCRKG